MPKFDSNVLKTQIKLAMGRIRLQQNKKGNSVKQQKREIAELLARGSDESARIKVESVIREDFVIEAFEILLLFCELLLARLAIISMEKHCPEEVKEAVYTIIYAAPRTEIPELRNVSSLLTTKFGSQIATQANDNCCGQVNARIVHKLRISTPETFLVYQYLNEIAKSHGVNWSYNPPEEFNPSLGLGSHTIASSPVLVGSSTMVTLPAPGGAVFPVFPTVSTQAPPNTPQFPAFHNAFAPNNQTGVFPSFPNVPQQGGFSQQPNPNNVFPSFPSTPTTMSSQQNPSNPGFPNFPQAPNFNQNQPTNTNNVFPSFPNTPSTPPSQSNTNPSNPGFPNFPQTPNFNQSQQPNPNVFPSFPNTPSTTPSQSNPNAGFPNFPQAPNFNPNTNARQIGGDPSFPSFPNPPSDFPSSNANTGFPNFPQTPSTQQPPSNRNENALGGAFPSFPNTPSTPPSQSNTSPSNPGFPNFHQAPNFNQNQPTNTNNVFPSFPSTPSQANPNAGFPNFPQTPNFNPNTKQGNSSDNSFPSFPAPSQTKPNTNALFPSFPNSRNIETDNNNVVDVSNVHLDLPSVPKQGLGTNNTQSSTSSANDDDLPDFDELSARFEALKKRNQ